MKEEKTGELIQSYFLGTISEKDLEELDRQLMENANLRAQFAATARLETNLRDASSSMPTVGAPPRNVLHNARRNFLIGLGAAAAILFCAVLLSKFRPESSHPQIARIAELNGSATWIADGQQEQINLLAGSELTGGTLEVSSLISSVKIIFNDGSSTWVSGPAVVTFSDGDAGKLIRVREGDLSLDVSPQPMGKPMRVITPSAEAVVLGTQFNISAKPTSTSLTVKEGLVRVTRLADGSVQEVEADQRIIAALEQDRQFKAYPRGNYVRSWKSELPRDRAQGKWIPSSDGHSGVLRAEAHMFGGDHGETFEPILLHSAVLMPSIGAMPPVLLTEGAKFRIRGKLDRGHPINIGFGTHHTRGGFSGKYATCLPIEPEKATRGHFDIVIPLDEFPARRSRFPDSPVGYELFWFWVNTVKKDVGLELHGVELIQADHLTGSK